MIRFPFMEGQEYNDTGKLPEEADRLRGEMLNADRALLKASPVRFKVEEMNELPEGRIDVDADGVTFECFFKRGRGRPLYVILNGSATTAPPEFKRWSWYKFIDGSMLNIADPMYRMYPDLRIGWYYGSENMSLRHYAAEIVRKAMSVLGIENRDLIFYGSSGGGAALIQCASFFGGCTAVAINPQICLWEYSGARGFVKATGIRLDKEDTLHRNDLLYFLKNCRDVNYILIQNLRSHEDMKQQQNIINALGIKLRLGLAQCGHLTVWTYDAPSALPHNAQEYYCIYHVIGYIIDRIRNGREADGEFIRWVTEMWYERAKCRNETDELRRSPVILSGGEYEKVMHKDALTVPEAGNSWNFTAVFGKLLPDTRYRLTCGGSEVISGGAELISVGIKDRRSGRSFLRQFPTGSGFVFEFISPSLSSDSEVRVYAGLPAKTGTTAVRLTDVTLEAAEKP